MPDKSFAKVLSANDIGSTGGHQAGILVPKTDAELLAFFPRLDADIKNPDAFIRCSDPNGREWRMRFVYYNNKLHDENGTRNEYRITYMTEFLRVRGARIGDSVIFSETDDPGSYLISILKSGETPSEGFSSIKLKGWRRVH